MTTYSELRKDPIKNREQLLAMDRAIPSHNLRCMYGDYKSNHNNMNRIPRKLKKHNKKHRRTAGSNIIRMFLEAQQKDFRDRHMKEVLNEIKAIHERISK